MTLHCNVIFHWLGWVIICAAIDLGPFLLSCYWCFVAYSAVLSHCLNWPLPCSFFLILPPGAPQLMWTTFRKNMMVNTTIFNDNVDSYMQKGCNSIAFATSWENWEWSSFIFKFIDLYRQNNWYTTLHSSTESFKVCPQMLVVESGIWAVLENFCCWPLEKNLKQGVVHKCTNQCTRRVSSRISKKLGQVRSYTKN